MGKDKSVVVGYKYKMGLHLVLGYPVDRLEHFKVDDREAWSGTASSGQINVDKPELFGGKSREGGVGGTIDILDGNASQPKNDYLLAQLGSLIPAYRGVFSLVFRRFYIGNNPYLKKMAFRVRRVATKTDGSAQWYSSKANINDGDLNPAHIIRECLTDSEWGMDYPASIIDDASFTAAADTLYAEDFGLSMLWNQQESIEQFVQRILDHIDGMLRENPATGDIGLYLIRDDYTPANLPLFDESNTLSVESYERRAWGETVNEVTVVYHDRATDKDVPITVQDIGNIQIQGAVVGETRQYPGIPNATLGARVGARDLRALSSPLSKLEIIVNRQAWSRRRGDPFRFSWAKYGLVEVIYRVTSIDDGDLVNGRIKITALEDVWGMPTSTYVAPQPSNWVSPNNAPAPAPYQQLVEASYWDVQQNVSQADIAQLDPDFGFVQALAVQPSGDAFHYQMMARVGAADYEEVAIGVFCPTAELDGALDIAEGGLTDAVINVRNPVDLEDVEVNTFAYLGAEMIAIRAVDTVANTITVDRGVLDTVPTTHADGTTILFADTNQGQDPTERVDAESVDVKLLPVTGLGALDESGATAMNLVMDNRYQRPYPPGNVRANGTAYPDPLVGFLTLTWSHRDRTQQTAYLNDQTEGNIGPEPGTTYNLRIYDEIDDLVVDETGLTVTTYDFTTETATPLMNYIIDTVAGGHFYPCNEVNTDTAIEDILSTWDRTLYGPTTVLGAQPLLNESLGSVHLPGVGDYIGQSDKNLTQNDQVTIFAIVEFGSLAGTHCIFQDGGTTRGLYFGLHGGDLGVWVKDASAGTKLLTISASSVLTAGAPAAVACLVDGPNGTISIQVDGVEVAQSSTLGAFTDFNGSNGMSFGGCYQTLSIDGTAAPIGGLGGYLDYFYCRSSLTPQAEIDQMFAKVDIYDGSGAGLNSQLRIELESVRDGLESMQMHNFMLSR